jgi:hypothetical protein
MLMMQHAARTLKWVLLRVQAVVPEGSIRNAFMPPISIVFL